MNGQSEWTIRAYVLAEIIISFSALIGGVLLVHFGTQEAERSVGATLVGAVTVFWFQRRASEQATNKIAEVSNGNLKALQDKVDKLLVEKTP